MEFSSPLAAMHPPSCPLWANGRDLPASHAMYGRSHSQTFNTNTFNFGDLSVKRSSSDYFALRPTTGSSPTASLAADLSSNFHIDRSPQIPTPRRSLFAKDLFLPFQGHLVTPPIEYEGATTPPIPDSSPCMDIMDVSPLLPHKVPSFLARVTLPSPSPEPTPDDDEEMLSPHDTPTSTIPLPTIVFPLQVPVPERRKPTLIRPSLLRSKGFSTTSIPMKSNTENRPPPFQFGLGNASTPSLVGTLSESPVEDNFPASFPSQSALKRMSGGGVSKANGSPSGVVRKAPAARPPPRKQVRRSLSMFQHPNDVMKQERGEYQSSGNSPTSMDTDVQYEHTLPHFKPAEEPDSLPRIQQETLINIINGQYDSSYDKIVVVDCRFEYEYKGGHIEGAVNYNDKELLAKDLFETPSASRTLLVFHCEYSVHRAPRMAKFVRNCDRKANAASYPNLTFPEMYILDGGYSKFFEQHRTKCFPQNYVEMDSKDHEQDCEKGMGKLKQRQKLNRAQTFAFGQQSPMGDDSPTTCPRMGGRSVSSAQISPEHAFAIGQTFARRMAAF